MAEGGSSINTTRESSVDSEVVKLKVKQKDCELTVTQTELSWTIKDQKKNGTFSVRRRDLVAVKTKEDVKNKDSTVLTVVYVKQQKDFVLKRCEESFSGSNSVCLAVAKTLQDGINQCADRPKRLLVLINPISGFSRGEKNYKNICAPIFEEAGIQTDVIVTQSAGHTKEAINGYNLQTINGIIFVSGDGMYHTLLNALFKRMAMELGKDLNDPNYEPPELTVSVGHIPCGSGNRIAFGANGCFDVATAVYAIVLGFKTKNNIFSVYSGNEFIAYAFMLVSGIWSDLLTLSEGRRSMGQIRIPLSAIQQFLIKSQRVADLTLKFKAAEDFSDRNETALQRFLRDHRYTRNTEKEASDSNTQESATLTVVRGPFVALVDLDVMVSSLVDTFHMPNYKPISDASQLVIHKPCSKWEMLKTMWNMALNTSQFADEPPEYALSLFVNEFSVHVNNPNDAESYLGRLERTLSIDGEMFTLKEPEFTARYYPGKVPIFCNIPGVTGRVG
ncbi:ceramide kinase-like isoform X4 [Dreissena polymorpha]|uniref:ceramide kinase-like isoform X4 n=1 Tax=Dreissena polymorpha TaxID=45954 RepID=UPI002264E5F0|nr:ceramide kinase-like isoform X4 [Dreissena polymorpha]